MSTLSQFGGKSRVTALISAFGWNSATNLSTLWPAISTNSGACTANVWKTILSVSGGGSRLNALMMKFNDSTARNGRVRVTVDGVVVFDATVANASSSIHVAVGQIVGGTTSSLMFQPVDALSSLLIEYQANLTETDKATLTYNYEVRT